MQRLWVWVFLRHRNAALGAADIGRPAGRARRLSRGPGGVGDDQDLVTVRRGRGDGRLADLNAVAVAAEAVGEGLVQSTGRRS
jgi:hypothetical protein